MVRELEINDIEACAKILCAVYNNDMWQCKWEIDTAEEYLKDYFKAAKFKGYCLEIDQKICGALFAHKKIWWNNSELFIDEMFVLPEYQGKGYGSELLKSAEKYVMEKQYAGITLSTNRYAPAPLFYKKNGYSDAEHILFMYKEV